MPEYTKKQGQYLAFIYYYTKINRQPPSEVDMQRFFRVTLPTVRQMVLTLEKRGFITREPRKARTIRVLLPLEELPDLE
jgi:Mn-dependent DtxR family transcriptional regulator